MQPLAALPTRMRLATSTEEIQARVRETPSARAIRRTSCCLCVHPRTVQSPSIFVLAGPCAARKSLHVPTMQKSLRHQPVGCGRPSCQKPRGHRATIFDGWRHCVSGLLPSRGDKDYGKRASAWPTSQWQGAAPPPKIVRSCWNEVSICFDNQNEICASLQREPSTKP